MFELVKCKVRDIKDKSGRWEIRLSKRALPLCLEKLAGNPIKLNFGTNEYAAYAGIASRNKTNQYFWVNTHQNEAGTIKSILERDYEPNDEIILDIDGEKLTAYVVSISVYEAIERKKHRHSSRLITQLKLNNPQTSKLHNIIDMGLDFSAMIRLFSRGSKPKLKKEVPNQSKR